jgi:hypothetical protein
VNGKEKARVFAAAPGLRKEDAGWLRERLLEAAHGEADLRGKITFGTLYMMDFELKTKCGEATVRSGWIVKKDEDFPRLTTCFVLKRDDD